jgi:hypothetical protein
MTRASAVTVQFPWSNAERRTGVIRAFRSLGKPEQGDVLEQLAEDVVRYLAYKPRRRCGRRKPPPLDERRYAGLDNFHLSCVNYSKLGNVLVPLSRGVRIVVDPVNGPVLRAVGDAEGEMNFLFWRLYDDGWPRLFAALGLDAENPVKGSPTGICFMPRPHQRYDFFQPLKFT